MANLSNRVASSSHRKGQINMEAVLIGLAIAGYTVYLIYRQVKNARAGNYCGSCSGCSSAKTCGDFKEPKESKGLNLGS